MLAALPSPTPYDYISQASDLGATWYQLLTNRQVGQAVLPVGGSAVVTADLSPSLLIVLGLVAVAIVLVFTLKRR